MVECPSQDLLLNTLSSLGLTGLTPLTVPLSPSQIHQALDYPGSISLPFHLSTFSDLFYKKPPIPHDESAMGPT